MANTKQVRQTIVFLWLLFALVALLGCAYGNAWMVYTAAETVLPRQLISRTVEVGGHVFITAALVLAVVFVGLELCAGAVAEHAYRAAGAKGFSGAHALRLFVVAAFLFVFVAWVELALVNQRAMTLQLDFDLLKQTLSEHQRAAMQGDIARTRTLFTLVTAVTLCLTTLLIGLVVRGFRTIAPTIGASVHRRWEAVGSVVRAVWSAIAFVVSVLLAAIIEAVLFAVAAAIFVVWGIVRIVGTAATWVTELLDKLLEIIIRRPSRAVAAFWRRLWTPVEIVANTLPPAAEASGAPPSAPATGVGIETNGTTHGSTPEGTAAPTSTAIEPGSNGASTPAGASTRTEVSS